LYALFCGAHPGLRKSTRRFMYQLIAWCVRAEDWSFMNYGYAPLEGQPMPGPIDGVDEQDRHSVQLYAHVVQGIDLTDADVLEIGSGRGGGSAFLRRFHRLRQIVGIDFSKRAVAICKSSHRAEGLTFLTGDAEHLPFSEACFDAVVNVESSHCYASMDVFLREVKRVLKPGGVFLYADFRDQCRLAELDEQLTRSGMKMERRTDITPNVLRSLDLGTDARLTWIQEKVPCLLRRMAREFAGVRGSNIYERFRHGTAVYQSFLLRAPQTG
jgi:ubiquinone/menaquinone biosynthesis C-methylase UbiE